MRDSDADEQGVARYVTGDRLGWRAACGVHFAQRGTMIRTVEAMIDEQGNVRLLKPVHLPSARRALVTILEDREFPRAQESALLSEAALAEDWNRPEEDEAWSHLQGVE